jgi:histidyl-tRNA synthetase
MQKPSLPKGTRDFLPDVMQKRKYIINTIEAVYQKFGFLPIETPALENLSTLTGKYGDEGDKLLFKVLNSGDYLQKAPEDTLTAKDSGALLKHISDKGLRYDLTVPLARFVVQNRNDLQMPFRRYQIQPVWRADKPQKGRYREFWQCDADSIGSDSLINETDLLLIYESVFEQLGLHVTVYINNRKILEGFAELIGAKALFKPLTIIIDKFDKIGIEGVSRELIALGLSEKQTDNLKDFLTQFALNTENLNELKNMLSTSEVGLKGIAELEEILALCEAGGLQRMPVFNGTLARGLDYYTGCIFEVVSNDYAMGSISGGGRYDNLTGVFGMDGLSGVGISFGIDRIYDVMDGLKCFPEQHTNGTQVLCTHFDNNGLIEGVKTAALLRKAGINTEVYPDIKKIQKQFDYANKRGIPYVIVWGQDEIDSQQPSLKNMKEGTQQKLTLNEIINLLK